MAKKKFEVGKLYSWVPRDPNEPEYMKESYMVWNPTRKDIFVNTSGTQTLGQKSVITILESHAGKYHYDLKILSTNGICGWIRIGKEFHDDWDELSL